MNYLQPQLLSRRRTKIVATLGPASNSPEVIEQLIEAGVNVFRLNFSHGDHETHRAAYDRVRVAAARMNEPIAVLADLCGPKIRAGKFKEGKIELVAESMVTVTTRSVPGEPGLIPSQYDALAKDVKPGNRILLDDGLLELRSVESVAGTEIKCSVVHGGILKDRKGMNLPGVNVPAPALTEKDRKDARFALEMGVDYLALSFVRRAEEVYGIKGMVKEGGHEAHVVAKIEKPEALADIDEILDATDAIMVARGDLGVELAPETVPIAQHQLVKMAQHNRPVIVATQMLESMIVHPRPTRAEVSDVSHAVFAGADAVMLSGETAAGAYPVQAVKMMDYVARHVEALQWTESKFSTLGETEDVPPPIPLHVAIARATSQLARDLGVRTIVVSSKTGATANMMSDARPSAPVLAIAASASVCRRMNLLWGVVPVQLSEEEFRNPGQVASQLARTMGLAEAGQFVLMISGVSSFAAGSIPKIAVLKT